jgi:hypothetical protein
LKNEESTERNVLNFVFSYFIEMPRKYVRKAGTRRYADYSEEDLRNALNDVQKGVSKATAARKYNISLRTLYNRIAASSSSTSGSVKMIRKPGGQPVFSPKEEKRFKNNLLACSDFGFPIDRMDLRGIVSNYLEKSQQKVPGFRNGTVPGIDWCYGFEKRHPDVSFRFAQNITVDRAAVNEEDLRAYVAELEKTVEGVPAHAIYNYDESNLSDDPKAKKVLVRRGCKYPQLIRNHSKAAISIMMCGNGVGDVLPPYVVYRAKKMWNSWSRSGPPGTRYNCSKSGWFEETSFVDWFKLSFLRHIHRKTYNGKTVLIGDNLSSHFNNEVLKLCEENNIAFVCLPPNMTHYCQPLDVAYFRPFKTAWRILLGEWKLSAHGKRFKTLPKEHFPGLLKKLMEVVAVKGPANLTSGFEACGIIPISADRLVRRALAGRSCDNEATDIDASFKDFLTALYKEAVAGPKRTRRMRRVVVPGRSVCAESSDGSAGEEEEDEDHIASTYNHESPDVSVRELAEESAGESSSAQFDTESAMEVEQPPAPELTMDDIIEGDFVVVRYDITVKKSAQEKLYVAQVERKYANRFNVACMRPLRNNLTTFIFPNIPDYDDVKLSQIVKKLQKPEERRGIFKFSSQCY